MKPRVAFQVPNTLTGEGNLSVDLTFESMDDFSPGAIARKVDSLKKLLDARTELSNLLSYMDGKTGAEELIARVLQGSGVAAVAGVGAEAGRRAKPRSDHRATTRNDPRSTTLRHRIYFSQKTKEQDNGSE